MKNAGGWRGTVTGWAVVASVRSSRSSRPTQFFGGIDSSSRVSGRTRRSGAVVVLACWQRFGAWWCAWPKRTPRGGYTRIVGALKNVGHRVSRSTIARMLKAHGVPPVPETADVVTDLSAGALGRDRRRGLLHDGSLELAGLGDLLHGVCHRPGVTPRAYSRVDTLSQRPVHEASGAHADRCGRGASHRPSGTDL
jgi:hypothetical protein